MDPEAIYTTNKTPSCVIRILAALLLLIVVYMIIQRLYVFAGFFAFLLLSALAFLNASMRDYAEVKVYNDYLTIGRKQSIIRTIAFCEVTNIGFLESATGKVTIGSYGSYGNEHLILLLRGNVRVELPQDLKNSHELCAIIQSRIS